MHSHVQPRKLVHVSGVHCNMRASSTSDCAFVYFTVQNCIEYSSTVSLFQAQDVRNKHKSSSDVAGTAKKCQAITMETKVKIIVIVEQGEKMVDVTHSYNMNLSAISMILKNKDKIMEHVTSAVRIC